MTWMRFEDDRRQQWQLNQKGLWLLCQQLAYAQTMRERVRVVAEDSPLFWRDPDLHNIEFLIRPA